MTPILQPFGVMGIAVCFTMKLLSEQFFRAETDQGLFLLKLIFKGGLLAAELLYALPETGNFLCAPSR